MFLFLYRCIYIVGGALDAAGEAVSSFWYIEIFPSPSDAAVYIGCFIAK
jgi:hypothetical protein